MISRGFRRKRADEGPRPPSPGQYVTTDFPVLSAVPTPRTRIADWSIALEAPAVKQMFRWGGGERGRVDAEMLWRRDEQRASAACVRVHRRRS